MQAQILTLSMDAPANICASIDGSGTNDFTAVKADSYAIPISFDKYKSIPISYKLC